MCQTAIMRKMNPLWFLIDRLAADYNEAQLAHLSEIFTACSRYEKAVLGHGMGNEEIVYAYI